MAMGPEELLAMTRDCGLNRLVQYAPFVSKHIRAAQQDDEVKRILQGMRQILHTGVALNPEDEKWGLENGLVLTVRSSFSSAHRSVSHRLGGQSMYGTSETGEYIHFWTTPINLMRLCSSTTCGETRTNGFFTLISPLPGRLSHLCASHIRERHQRKLHVATVRRSPSHAVRDRGFSRRIRRALRGVV